MDLCFNLADYNSNPGHFDIIMLLDIEKSPERLKTLVELKSQRKTHRYDTLT